MGYGGNFFHKCLRKQCITKNPTLKQQTTKSWCFVMIHCGFKNADWPDLILWRSTWPLVSIQKDVETPPPHPQWVLKSVRSNQDWTYLSIFPSVLFRRFISFLCASSSISCLTSTSRQKKHLSSKCKCFSLKDESDGDVVKFWLALCTVISSRPPPGWHLTEIDVFHSQLVVLSIFYAIVLW